MESKLAQRLALLHSEFGVYDSIAAFNELKNYKENPYNILNLCKRFDSLKVFTNFYEEYFKHYDSQLRNSSEKQISLNTKQTRGIDLPFLGDKVIKSGKAKFMFVFEGSLSVNEGDKAKLSITVLSNFWQFSKD